MSADDEAVWQERYLDLEWAREHHNELLVRYGPGVCTVRQKQIISHEADRRVAVSSVLAAGYSRSEFVCHVLLAPGTAEILPDTV